MSDGFVRCELFESFAVLTFDRPESRNAMTWKMYQELHEHCLLINKNRSIRCVVLKGAGGEAFVAGTDIKQFQAFSTGQDGIEYERRSEEIILALETLCMPTIAVVEKWAIGGGLAIAAVCDLRIATPDARFGIPIARTLGNTLSNKNYARLIEGFGSSRVKRMLMLSELISAEEALNCGFLKEIVLPESINSRVDELVQDIINNAPLSIRAGKESIHRILRDDIKDFDEDLIESCYGSKDFKAGIDGFINKIKTNWTGY